MQENSICDNNKQLHSVEKGKKESQCLSNGMRNFNARFSSIPLKIRIPNQLIILKLSLHYLNYCPDYVTLRFS